MMMSPTFGITNIITIAIDVGEWDTGSNNDRRFSIKFVFFVYTEFIINVIVVVVVVGGGGGGCGAIDVGEGDIGSRGSGRSIVVYV